MRSGPTLVERAQAVADAATANTDMLDRDGAFPDDEIRKLHDSGLLHAPFPAALGGCDLGSDAQAPILLFDILAAIGGGSLALGRLYEGHVNAVKLVSLYGSPENLLQIHAEADAGRLTGVWMAEDDGPLTLRTTEAPAGDAGVLQGRKCLCSGAGHIVRPLVAAVSERGSVLMLPSVPERSRVDLTAWTASGMKATATGTVDFTGVRIAASDRVGAPGDYMRSPYFRGGAWRVMAVQFGGLRALLEAYRKQIVDSGRDGDRLQRARFADAARAVETARLWLREACCRAEMRADPRAAIDPDAVDAEAIDAYIDLMRGTFEQAAGRVIEHAQKSLGLKAFLRPNPVDRIIRDLTTYLRQPALDASADSAAAYLFHHPDRTRRV